jgi:hypothetical protein
MPVDTRDLDPETLMARARAQSGLDDFGPHAFLPALTMLAGAIDREAGLKAAYRDAARAEILSALRNRLRATDWMRRHPEIAAEEIVAPVIIVGPQRSGTSKLFRLLAADPRWNVLHTWEALNPAPLSERFEPMDARLALAEDWAAGVATTGMNKAHRVSAREPEMESLILMQSFVAPSPRLLVPSHQHWAESADHRPAYAYLRDLLRVVQWQRGEAGRRRWLLKTPYHLHNLDALMATFPDARLVMTHRDPVVSAGSMMAIAEMVQRQLAAAPDVEGARDAWFRIVTVALERCAAFRAGGELEALFADIPYARLMADSAGALRAIYDHAGIALTDAAIAAAADHERVHVQHKDGRHDYAVDDSLRARVARATPTYQARFGGYWQ